MSSSWVWYTARAAGMTAWVLLALTVVLGLVRSTNLGRRVARPVWVIDLHRFLGALTVIFTGVHVTAILADTYVHFDIVGVLVPFSASWHPVAVAWGTIALYLLMAVELTSLAQRRLPRGVWRRVHYATVPLFATATVHGLSAGTDRSAMTVITVAVALIAVVTSLLAMRVRRAARPKAAPRSPHPRPPAPPEREFEAV